MLRAQDRGGLTGGVHPHPFGPPSRPPPASRAVITFMSADGPETFTETVATERGALIPAGLNRALRQPGACQHGADQLVATFGGQDQAIRLRDPAQTLNSSGWSRRASDSAI